MQTVMNEELAQWFAENDYFYIMHRFNEENRIPFIKKMHHAGLFASISVGVKENEFNFIEKLASSSLIPEYITIDIAPVSYTHLTLPTTCTRCRSRWSPYH